MCGIAAALVGSPVSQEDMLARVVRMGHAQHFRGPDGSGAWADQLVALSCVRLAIVGDLVAGVQPIADPYGGHLVFNGEVYNYQQLATSLEKHPPPGASDGWVLSCMLARRGPSALADVRGMFAIARWDPAKGTLLLARDALGKKPLYLRRFPEGWLAASTVAALVAGAGPVAIREEALHEYLVYRSVGGYNSAFRDIEQIPPGTWLELGPHGSVKRGKWWTAPAECDRQGEPQVVRALVDKAVADRVPPDHEVSVFVSGGLDSAIVAASTLRQRPEQSIRLWTVGYDVGGNEDETPLAMRLARETLSVPIERVVLRATAVPGLMQDAARFLEDPIQDPVTLPTLVLARAAVERSKVVLTGDGSDEVWGGYARFRPPPSTLRDYLPRTTLFTPTEIGLKDPPASYLAGVACPPRKLDIQDRVLRLEVSNRMRNYHLARVDKLTMAVGLEARCPFVDEHVVNEGLRIPSGRKQFGGRAKGLLAEAFVDDLPPWLIQRHKQPFSVPITTWLAGPLKSFAIDTLTASNRLVHWVDARGWLADLDLPGDQICAASKVWSLLQLEAWYQAIDPYLGGSHVVRSERALELNHTSVD